MAVTIGKSYKNEGAGPLHWCGFVLALVTALAVAAQLGYLLVQGAPFCPTEGCRIVDEQAPLPQWAMNGGGLAYFGLLAALFILGRRRDGAARGLIDPLLLAGIAAEGVFFTFQYQTGAFCLYCCAILGALALINLLRGVRQFLRALFVFVAVCLCVFVFTTPRSGGGGAAAGQGLGAGVMAHRPGPAGAEERFLFFSKDCTHCKAALAALLEDRGASLSLNPIDRPDDPPLPADMESGDFAPEANRAVLKALGIETVPVLLVRQAGGEMRIILGDRKIIRHIEAGRKTEPTAPPSQSMPQTQIPQTQIPQTPQTPYPQEIPKNPADEFLNPEGSCSVDAGCGP